MKLKKYKYVHALWVHDIHLKFYSNLIDLINNNLCREEHLFVTSDKEAYSKLNKWGNVEFYHTRNPNSAGIIRYCLRRGQWVIMHGIMTRMKILFLKPWDYKRIIWRTWGGSFDFQYREGEHVKNLIKRFITYFRKKIVQRYYAIGVANDVDIIHIRQAFGNVNMVQLNYTSSDVDRLRMLVKPVTHKGATINIMLGHSGYSNDNHICLLELLKKFQSENILIHLIFSYGDAEYMESVEKYISKNWPEKIMIHRQFMKLEDYLIFLNQMDIAIFDSTGSYALDNICWLIEMEKTIVLNRYGVIKKAFDENSIPYVCSDCLAAMSLDELVKKRDFSKIGDGMKIPSYCDAIKRWKDFLTELDETKNGSLH